MPKTILVTGANGHLGANLVRCLIKKGYGVRPFVRKGADLRGISNLGLEYYYGDVCDQQSLVQAARGCDVIIHLAAVYKLWARNARDIMQPSIEGTRNVFVAAVDAGVKRVVYTSSVTAIGAGLTPTARNEEDWSTNKKFQYAVAKTESEKAAWQLSREMSVPMISLCPGHILGRYDYRITPSNRIILDMVKGIGLTIVMGLSTVDVRDAAEIHALSVENGEPGHRYVITGNSLMMEDLGKMVNKLTDTKVYHLSTGRSINVVTGYCMGMIAKLTGWVPPLTYGVACEYSHRYMFYSNSKMLGAFTHKPFPIEETLRDTIAWLNYLGYGGKSVRNNFPADKDWNS